MMHSARKMAIHWLDRLWPVAMAVVALVLLVALYVWEPAAGGMFPPCPFHTLTGLHCPGCGSLRAIHQLLHGELWAAFRFNPLMVTSLPLLAFAVGSAHWPQLRPQWVNRVTSHPDWPVAILVAVLLYWLLRNLPFEPFSWLAPHAL